ncbi:hypothetical protein L207DRAFT_508727 [Hyaloscypha variabilis F]|uniref:Uncharacterized protein n=1 Tax=Hyaloscypha variabilis (strain UAMH 11265 / GT02V1 / F) TaxID=1149755 RepID=A0A2J6RZN5_HYAVF|nr:hypothetical protein L207DRAFT_508727 [Hyaloscypha variabilis F]
MAGKRSSPRKRAISEVENVSPARKRVNIEAKSPKTAIRDASEALIEAIKQAEEVHLHLAKDGLITSQTKNPKGAARKGGKAIAAVPESGDFEFEKDDSSGLPYVYIVLEKSLLNSTEEVGDEVLKTFASLDDANNFVRNHCADNAERDDPDAIFDEAMSPDGRISWSYEDESGYGTQLRIEKCKVNRPGSVPARNWGRPIGEPCPEKEESEEESSSEDDEFRRYEKEIEFRTHRYRY